MRKKPSVNDKARAVLSTTASTVATRVQTSPSTAPGIMAAHMARESAVFVENEHLKKTLASWDGAVQTRVLDPALVRRSETGNRHEDSFKNEAFIKLKEEISQSGGNLVPAKVCPVPDTNPQEYRVVWGQRRHQACLELKLPFLAVIEELSEKDAFVEADRENRAREDLSPYEQGLSYKHALDAGIFSSARNLASELDVNVSNVSLAIRLALLQKHILDAFESPLDLQYRWSGPLYAAATSYPDRVNEVANLIADERLGGRRVPSKEVFLRLSQIDGAGKAGNRKESSLFMGTTRLAVISESRGKTNILFEVGALSHDKKTQLTTFLKGLLGADEHSAGV